MSNVKPERISLHALGESDLNAPLRGQLGIVRDEIAELQALVGIDPSPPVVTGDRDKNEALANLLTALTGLGLIVDHTTDKVVEVLPA